MPKRCDPELIAAMAQRLRLLRRERMLTQAGLARKVGTDPTALSLIERGERGISLCMLVRLARGLNLSPVAFLGLILEEVKHVDSISAGPGRFNGARCGDD